MPDGVSAYRDGRREEYHRFRQYLSARRGICEKEVTNPTRVVTSSVGISGAAIARVSVKTASDIPKDKIFDCMREIRGTAVKAPGPYRGYHHPKLCRHRRGCHRHEKCSRGIGIPESRLIKIYGPLRSENE